MKRTECSILREQIFSEVLDCGLSLYILPKRGFRQKSGLLAVDFGAVDQQLFLPGRPEEMALPDGAAHFLEHRLFEKPEGDITECFSALGAEVDAHTTFTSTAFSFSCPDHFLDNLELLLQLAFCLVLTEEGVEREREIIRREIQLSADSLEWVSYFNALEAVYPGQSLATDIAGTLESIQTIDRDLLSLCHQTFYQPANCGLFVCGDVDVEEIRSGLDAWMPRQAEVAGVALQKNSRRFEPAADPGTLAISLGIAQPHLLLAFGDPRAGCAGEPLLRRELALEMTLDMLFGPSSRFFNEGCAAGWIDAASFGFEVSSEPAFAVCLVGGETRQPARLEAAIVDELKRVRQQGIETCDFQRTRRKTYGHLLRGFDQVENCVQLMHGAVSCGAEPFDYFQAYQCLTLDEVADCLETCLDWRRYGMSRVDLLSAEEAF